MNSSYRLTRRFLTINRHCCVYVRNWFGTLIRQSLLCNRLINGQQTTSKRFITGSRAYLKSVQKFGRQFREKVIAKERLKMSGDSTQALAPLQAAVKEKVSFEAGPVH